MNDDWKDLERLVAAIHNAQSQGGEVRWNDSIAGRQFDVTIRFKFGIHDYLCVVECKNHSSKISVDKVDAFATKARDAHANKAVMVSSSDYQSGCVEVANRHGIRLLTLTQITKEPESALISEITPALNVYSVRLIDSKSSSEYELENEGGRLAYLMGNTVIRSAADEKTLSQIIDTWQWGRPAIDPEKDNDIEIPFSSESIACIPYEENLHASAVRFKCKLIEAAVPNRPVPDNHIMEAFQTEIELRDPEGNLQHASRLSDLKWGYDTEVQTGKFYVIPSLSNYYFCEEIDGDKVTWILVESYQHGRLVRARMTQDIQYSGYYMEVSDERTLRRLRKLLDEFNGYKR